LLRRIVDRLLLALLGGVAFLLGCYEMGDSDIWWHLRGGQWILEQRRVPDLDPFTFGSADRRWIDIHWAYEVILALVHRAGGVGALVLLGAAVGAIAFMVCLTARRREWSVPVAILCWLPALVLFSFRLDPRPEIFSLCYIGCFLAVLWRAEERPALAWILPGVQVLWVNMQGLFVFGPLLIGLFAAAHAATLAGQYVRGQPAPAARGSRWWVHVGGATVGVALACLVNPYFLDGARFPLDLFPKVAESGNLYKRYIDELMSPRDYVLENTAAVAGKNWFFLSCHFLLLLLPLSFLYPSLWRALRQSTLIAGSGRRRGRSSPPALAPTVAAQLWLSVLAAGIGVLVASTITLSRAGAGVGANPGRYLPWLFVLAGLLAACFFSGSRATALFAVVAGVAMAGWMAWLRDRLIPAAGGSSATTELGLLILLAAIGAAAGGLVLLAGGNLFRLLLAGAFAYLALAALQNWSRFALVAGTVIAWNFAEWWHELTEASFQLRGRLPYLPHTGQVRQPAPHASWQPIWAWSVRGGLALALPVWIALLLSDRYYVHTGELRRFAFREQPLEFAHEAAVFAGQPGLPERALIYGLGQTGVYVFHNSPRGKPFLDGRLEMPAPETFARYVAVESWLADNDPRWQQALADMGNPLLLVEHRNHMNAEAAVLAHPGWRCVYYDALAAVFLRQGSSAGNGALPPLDFAARHFTEPGRPSVPSVPGAAALELKALFNLSVPLPRSSEVAWRWRIPILLSALDRADAALGEEPARPDLWALAGNCYWNLNPDLLSRPPGPAEGWRLERGIYWAQATYCLRRAVEFGPEHGSAWRALSQCYRARGMADAQLAAAQNWLRTDPKATPQQREQIVALERALGESGLPPPSGDLGVGLSQLLQAGRPLAARQLLEQPGADANALVQSWPLAEQAAGVCLHLGEPALARRYWERARDCPSAALRHCRLATTFWVERDLPAARRHFEAARQADPQLAEADWGLTLLSAQAGDATTAFQVCEQGLKLVLSSRQRSDLESLHALLSRMRHAHGQAGADEMNFTRRRQHVEAKKSVQLLEAPTQCTRRRRSHASRLCSSCSLGKSSGRLHNGHRPILPICDSRKRSFRWQRGQFM
jgi:tetratricopeptide (TPR) repeat protein